MRETLREIFLQSYFLNLHDTKREQVPEGKEDKNVFDIQQGVSISFFVRAPGASEDLRLYSDLWGNRHSKCKALSDSTVAAMSWKGLNSTSPYFFFVPKVFSAEDEYIRYVNAKDIFPAIGKGVKTERDHVSIHFTPEGVRQVIADFRTYDVKVLRERYSLNEDSRDWKVASAKADAQANDDRSRYLRTGSRIDEELDNTIRTAVRRGILESKNGMLKLAVCEHYDRAHLKDQFLASLSGQRWVDRDDAISRLRPLDGLPADWIRYRRNRPLAHQRFDSGRSDRERWRYDPKVTMSLTEQSPQYGDVATPMSWETTQVTPLGTWVARRYLGVAQNSARKPQR
jgi:predicted helicase